MISIMKRGSILFAILLTVLTISACQVQAERSEAAEPTIASPESGEPTATISLATKIVEATPTRTPRPDDWKNAPVIPDKLSEKARAIYTLGIDMGRDANVFSKVGDCGGTPSWFLGPFDLGPKDYRLGEYEHLAEVIAYFQGSYGRTSSAVHDGFNAASILSPIRADRELCEDGENPLACEYRLNNPSIALIMIGTNDVYHVDEFEGRVRQIIEYTIEQGILPVIASKPDNLEGDHAINRILYSLALEYELPFWNLWRSFQDLPDKGLQEDGAHITFAAPFFDDEYAMQAGWPWRNLTALQTLDFLMRELGDS
jgi:hypothetical protein